MKNNDDEFDDDQTSTRLKVHDRTRVLDSGRSVIMIAWRAGVWRRNLKVLLILIVVAATFMIWRSFNKEEPVAAANTEEAAQTAVASDVDYTKLGKGLVYSCFNKKFFCLDKSNYYKCRESMKTGGTDCITRGVLESTPLCKSEIQGKKPTGINCP